ncbi:50S ribosomal protein L9 [Desulfofustis glycolicus]|uniref:Large ribosomal subunit protein bL9 n=1 Tax=Desulfofustis glycolicus DSM 9705 TaxID=1121409 RepID=A0A1M5WVL1_9BACT|nr:50S ribosomal protein L9 [Desulfofustis glycolicus]MCB2214467.1 50S ribosomal protein L9 [Desulfobulbaceae bacterium]SHH91531.1 LSU ribosomal protein L9P [Desulfofustis glycolicus DSM 9705]
MELILKQTIEKLGREGDIIKVKPGYGRNYLLPQGKAVLATPTNLAVLEKHRAEIQARLASEQKQAEAALNKLNGVVLEFDALVGDDDKLFGSISVNDICEKLADKKIVVEKKQVILSEPIKSLGERQVSVKVGFDLFAEITVKVSAQQSDA